MGKLFTRGDQVFLVVCVVIIAGLICWRLLPRASRSDLEIVRPDDIVFRLDINSATWVEWMQLEGIGETTARKIVADRELHGPFASLEEVMRIKGIGPATFNKIRPHLVCPNCSDGKGEAK